MATKKNAEAAGGDEFSLDDALRETAINSL